MNLTLITLDSQVVLIPVGSDDGAALYALVDANSAFLRPWMPFAHEQTPANSEAFIATALAEAQAGTAYHFTVRLAAQIVGAIGLHHIDRPNRIAQIGYWLSASACGQGIATRAARAVVSLAFDALGLNRIELRIQPENARSRAVALRLGCVYEGRLSEAECMPDGFRDLDLFAVIARHWKSSADNRIAQV